MRKGLQSILPVLVFVISMVFCDSCKRERLIELKANKADTLIYNAGDKLNYDRMLFLTDSLAEAGDISEMNANRWRGTAYYHMGQFRTSEFYYEKVVDATIQDEQDLFNLFKSARRLADMRVLKGDYEGALKVALPIVKKMEESGKGSLMDFAIMLHTIGCCQLNLGNVAEAAESYQRSYQYYQKIVAEKPTKHVFVEAVIGLYRMAQDYVSVKRYAEAQLWIDHSEKLLDQLNEMPDHDPNGVDEYYGRLHLCRAIALQGQGQTAEADLEYKAFLATNYGRSGIGHLDATEYLMTANRWTEAANNYHYLDQVRNDYGLKLTLDNIRQYLLPKFVANVGAARSDSAIAVGTQICQSLDSAIIYSKKNDAAELATIYGTQQKEAQIAKQQAELTHQRLLWTGISLVGVIAFFLTYTIYRRRAQQHLAEAHEKLQKAYDQLEETTAIKERIESELRIARDIQMSMVPTIAPDHEGLDLYASMTPAKEVGGDLYGYLLLGDSLYFCIGDVSGKGVPASLFMAQATRLFRTLATQHMMPAEIATRMNAALAEDNEQGMFVTMFLGLIDLNTGRLDFCNAGHNPPLIKNDEWDYLQMVPNAPIGLWTGLEYEGEQVENIEGKPFFVYTDGLNEAENNQQEQLGDDTLLQLLRYTAYENAQQVVETLSAEVEKHRGGAEPNDDLTMLCLRVK